MKLIFLYVGKTEKGYLSEGVDQFTTRVKRYTPFEEIEVSEDRKWSKLNKEDRLKAESSAILSHIEASDIVLLLDENGKEYTSENLANYLQKIMNSGPKRLVFVVGGPFGFSESMKKRFPSKLALSKMTFSHQMVRLFLAEQVYRAFAILRNEPYHNP